jgi:hypothetical protein
MILYIGTDEDIILQVDLNVEQSKLPVQQLRLLTILKRTLAIAPIGDGETNLPSKIMSSNEPTFSDTADQSTEFNNYLNLLVKYNILPKTPTV